MPAHLIDLTGKRFGMLTVICRDYSKKTTAWKCKCDCGNETIVTTKHLNPKQTKSCGCLNHKAKYYKHGMARTNIYRTWIGMKRRCFKEDDEHYKYWGARGITVCDEWKNDFKAFYDYVSILPHYGEEGRTIDRIDVNGNYEPGNVRWATHYEQVHNRRKRKDD